VRDALSLVQTLYSYSSAATFRNHASQFEKHKTAFEEGAAGESSFAENELKVNEQGHPDEKRSEEA
jgi:hypothetical protein